MSSATAAPRATAASSAARDSGDAGSVTPLILGMVAGLLLLAAGLTAATSVFLAQQRLRGACDGAAVAGADAVSATAALSAATPPVGGGPAGSAQDAVAAYLGVRSPGVTAAVTVTADTVTLTCSATADITFGSLFGAGRMEQHVVSVASARL